MTRQNFLKTLGSFLLGILGMSLRGLSGRGNDAAKTPLKEARYYSKADHLAG